MPIRPENRSRYPADWLAFSRRIRFDRAGGRCECQGQCGLHRTHPGPRRCVERHGEAARWARGIICLTVAHLDAAGGPCRCDPLCDREDHVLAMCQRCHLRYDAAHHAETAAATRRAKLDNLDLWR